MNNGSATFGRYIPLACWIAVLLTTLFICLKIIGYGYLPEGDARRHAAKPFANKSYSQILLLRPEYVVDHSPGSRAGNGCWAFCIAIWDGVRTG
jgi:hypothetical protein